MNCPDCGKFISLRFPMHYCAKPKNRVVHYAPTDAETVCGIKNAKHKIGSPSLTSCKRCVAALMPWAKEVWNEAHQ